MASHQGIEEMTQGGQGLVLGLGLWENGTGLIRSSGGLLEELCKSITRRRRVG